MGPPRGGLVHRHLRRGAGCRNPFQRRWRDVTREMEMGGARTAGTGLGLRGEGVGPGHPPPPRWGSRTVRLNPGQAGREGGREGIPILSAVNSARSVLLLPSCTACTLDSIRPVSQSAPARPLRPTGDAVASGVRVVRCGAALVVPAPQAGTLYPCYPAHLPLAAPYASLERVQRACSGQGGGGRGTFRKAFGRSHLAVQGPRACQGRRSRTLGAFTGGQWGENGAGYGCNPMHRPSQHKPGTGVSGPAWAVKPNDGTLGSSGWKGWGGATARPPNRSTISSIAGTL